MAPTCSKPAPAEATRFWQKINLIAEISEICRKQRAEAPSYVEVLELIQAIIPFDAGSLYLKDASGFFAQHAVLGQDVPLPDFLISEHDSKTKKWKTSIRKPLLWSADADEFDADPDYVATLSVPLLCDDDVIGVLSVGSYVSGVLTERHIQLLAVVADQLAVSVERLERIAEIEAQNEALREAHHQLVAGQKRIIAAEKLAAVVDLAAGINHGINNPLAVIVGQVQCLQLEQPNLGVGAMQRLKRVEQAAVKIGEINRRLLKIDSIVAGDAPDGSDGCPPEGETDRGGSACLK